MKKFWRKQLINRVLFIIWLALVIIPVIFVFFWMFLSSVKTQMQNTAIPPVLFFTPTFDNYLRAIEHAQLVKAITNSLIIALGSCGMALILGLPAAYSLARWSNHSISLGILTARMMPGISYVVPWFIFFNKLNLIGTPLALILSHLTITLPLVIWTMISFYEDLPRTLRDAAFIDGCNEYTTFGLIYLPLSRPGIVVSGILAFIFSWNNFMYSLVLGGSKVNALPVAVYRFIEYAFIDWGGLNATAVIVTIPVLVLTLLVQKHIVKGLTFGSIKG